MHLWHDIRLGDKFPDVCTVCIEINIGCKNKFELDKYYGVIKLDRVLMGASRYPFNYGFFPQTYADDGDPLDAVVLGQTIIYPGCIVDVKPIGVIQMKDQGFTDAKVVCVPLGDPAFCDYNDISDLKDYQQRELKRFFEEYKILENKEVLVSDPGDAQMARSIIVAGRNSYIDNIEKNTFMCPRFK
jgi:inorganic pyrophosphatase